MMLHLDLSVHGDYYLPQLFLEGGESSLDINVLAPTYELLGEVSLEGNKGAQMLRLDLRVHAAPVIVCKHKNIVTKSQIFNF
jgi:hypothetical protein